MNELYQTLGVAPSVDADGLKKAYRALAKKWHPDLNSGDKQAEARFKAINEAYEVLGDPEKRKKYDETQHTARQREPQKKSGTASRKPPTGPMDFSAMQDGFSRFFGFDPATGKITDEEKVGGKRDPLDTTDLFERFMGFK